MGARAFKYFTIQAGGTPQPLVGTWLTATVTQPQVSASRLQGGLIQNSLTLTVNDSSMCVGAEYVNVIDPSSYATERVRLITVPTSTTITVQGLQKSHVGGAYGTGAWVALGDMAESVVVQALDGNSGSLFVGDAPQMVTATGVHVLKKITAAAAGTQPNEVEFSSHGPAFTQTLSQFWIDGTTGDSYLPSLITV